MELVKNKDGQQFLRVQSVVDIDPSWAYSGEAREQARELQRRCILLEGNGFDVSFDSVVSRWEHIEDVNHWKDARREASIGGE